MGNNLDSICKILRDFSEHCKLDVFMNLCMLDYVGYEKVDISLNVQEICRKIGAINQVWNAGGRATTDTPDELFDEFS